MKSKQQIRLLRDLIVELQKVNPTSNNETALKTIDWVLEDKQ